MISRVIHAVPLVRGTGKSGMLGLVLSIYAIAGVFSVDISEMERNLTIGATLRVLN